MAHRLRRGARETPQFCQNKPRSEEAEKMKKTPGRSVPTYDGIPPENVSIENVKGQVTETPRNLAVEVLSVEGAGHRQRGTVRFYEAVSPVLGATSPGGTRPGARIRPGGNQS